MVRVRAHEAPAPRVDALFEVWHVVPELVGVCYDGIAFVERSVEGGKVLAPCRGERVFRVAG